MSLKSGLLTESPWALDNLNVLLKEDRSMSFCQLSTLPVLLDSLVEHWSDTRECMAKSGGEKIEGILRFTKRPAVELDEKVVLMDRSERAVTVVKNLFIFL